MTEIAPDMTSPKPPRIIGTLGPMTGLDYEATKFERSWHAVCRWTKQFLCGPDETVAICPAVFSFPNTSRDHMCRFVQGEWLVMLDADMVHAPDCVARLLAAQKQIEEEHGQCGVVTGVYPRRNIPPDTILVHHYNPITQLWDEFQPEEMCFDAPGQCDAAGAGAMLIMRWVIERIVMELNVGPFSVWGPLRRASPVEPLGAGTDDLAFCRRLQVLDPPVQLWYTPDVTPGHLSSVPMTMFDWLKVKRRQRVVEVQSAAATKPR